MSKWRKNKNYNHTFIFGALFAIDCAYSISIYFGGSIRSFRSKIQLEKFLLSVFFFLLSYLGM